MADGMKVCVSSVCWWGDDRLSLLKKAAGLAKGSPTPNKEKVGTVTRDQILEIVKIKDADLNATDEAMAARMIEGTARSMGIIVEE